MVEGVENLFIHISSVLLDKILAWNLPSANRPHVSMTSLGSASLCRGPANLGTDRKAQI